jgi:Suppressor of fused protein (SUFU)
MDFTEIKKHYEDQWREKAEFCQWQKGPVSDLPENFGILKFQPSLHRNMWIYATCGMSKQPDSNRIELHLFSPCETQSLVELLTVVAHYHLTGDYVDVGHTVNFGRPWLPNSRCDHGLISLPYLDGPDLEWLVTPSGKVRFLWLIPVTLKEVEFLGRNGLEAMEKLFEHSNFNYLDPARVSVIA